MNHTTTIMVGPRGFRVGSAWPQPIAALRRLYADYPPAPIADFTVRLEPISAFRRWVRPSVSIAGDHMLPGALPVSLAHGLLAAEMAMNLQMALGERQYLLLHAASVEQGGRALIITGESGSGKSTLSALLGGRDWRFMGDEFALIDPDSGMAHPFPRPVSLKNASIDVMRAALPGARFGDVMLATPKGDICHLVPAKAAIAAMVQPAAPAMIIFPTFGLPRAVRDVGPSEAFVRLTQASTNYVALGERGFAALTRLVTSVRSVAIDYPDTKTALALVKDLAGAAA